MKPNPNKEVKREHPDTTLRRVDEKFNSCQERIEKLDEMILKIDLLFEKENETRT